MGERFFVKQIHICPFDRTDLGKLSPKINEYPARYCIIDEEKQIAIDIELKLKYDYVETISWLNFINQSYEKIQDDKRVAVCPYRLMNDNDFDLVEAIKIINNLKNGYEYPDGNETYNNQQYLEYIALEKAKEEKLRIKKIGKKRK